MLLKRRRAEEPSGAELMQVHVAGGWGRAGGPGNEGPLGTEVYTEGKDRSVRASESENGGSSLWMASFRRGCCKGDG